MEVKKFMGKHIILLLLYLGDTLGASFVGLSRVVKSVFLFGEEVKDTIRVGGSIVEMPSFGECVTSDEIINDVMFLIGLGFVEDTMLPEMKSAIEFDEYVQWVDSFASGEERDILICDINLHKFALTDKGRGFIEKVWWVLISEYHKGVVLKFVQGITDASFGGLCRYMYLHYGDV